MKCQFCGNTLHTYTQACGPYVRNAAGDLEATGSMTLVECHTPGCSLYYVTASEKMYQDTIGRFLQSKAASHA